MLRIMQTIETGEIFCAASNIRTVEQAQAWINANESLYPESTFSIDVESSTHSYPVYDGQDVPY